MEQQNTKAEQRSWMKNSVMMKVGVITVLMLLLLIPLAMIESLIEERETLSERAINEVSSKWANQQELKGPILTIPLLFETEDKDGNIVEYEQNWFLLPDQLNINGNVSPKELERGIYKVIVYTSKMLLDGEFSVSAIPQLVNLKKIQYDNAFLTIGISDLRGIKNKIEINWDSKSLGVEPGTKIPELVRSGVTIPIKIDNEEGKKHKFSFSLDLQGSQNLSFTPLGATTKVKITSDWEVPSFVGNFLPDTREVNENGFSAEWKVLQLNRNYPQSWIGSSNSYRENIQQTAFGVNLLLPMDDYRASMRSAKYGAMTIALTFLIFFLVEVINKKRIHPLQYAMVGIALCLFYTLLVSISEHSSFETAFGIATAAIISLISLYSLTLFKSKKLSLLLFSILIGLYTFLFTTLQMVDYALLMGSIGLTIILGATMYYTRKINWYKLNLATN